MQNEMGLVIHNGETYVIEDDGGDEDLVDGGVHESELSCFEHGESG